MRSETSASAPTGSVSRSASDRRRAPASPSALRYDAAMPNDTEKPWTKRDELAAALFRAVVTGTLADGRGIAESSAKANALMSYRLADTFFEARGES